MTPMQETQVDGNVVHDIIESMVPLLSGRTRIAIVAAALSLAVGTMDPELDPDQLHEAVKGCSQWLSMYLSSLHVEETDSIPKEQVN